MCIMFFFVLLEDFNVCYHLGDIFLCLLKSESDYSIMIIQVFCYLESILATFLLYEDL